MGHNCGRTIFTMGPIENALVYLLDTLSRTKSFSCCWVIAESLQNLLLGKKSCSQSYSSCLGKPTSNDCLIQVYEASLTPTHQIQCSISEELLQLQINPCDRLRILLQLNCRSIFFLPCPASLLPSTS